jgi:dihydroflavonol-4-reductase
MMGADTEVFLTGATGFVGGHVLRALLQAGYRVRALVRPGSPRPPALVGCRLVTGTLEQPGALAPAMQGCRYLVHCAALYSFAPADRRRLARINVAGTRGLLEAARIAGVERAVVTSSSVTVGPASPGRPATEAQWAPGDDGLSAYHASKIAQQRAALAARVPVVLVLPTAPVGPGDWKPTPTGRVILDFLRGRIVATVAGGMNVVAVEDVARAHVLALERGQPGERYLVGGENLSFRQLWQLLAAVTGRPAPRVELPLEVPLALAWADELRCRLLRAQPVVPLEGVRLARHYMYVDDTKAREELGHQPSPVREALARAVAWYREHGYVA